MSLADRTWSFKTKGRSNACAPVIILLALNAFFAHSAFGELAPDDGKVRVVLNAEEFSIIKDDDGFDVIMMNDFAATTSPGDPMLVHKLYNVLVPPNTIGEDLKLEVVSADIQVLDGTYEIGPVGPLAPGVDGFSDWALLTEYWGEGKTIADGKNLDVYEIDANYPEDYVKLLPYSELRKWKFAKLDFTPLQYNPVSKKLTLIKKAVVDISYKTSPDLMDRVLASDTVMEDVASELFSNYKEGKAWYDVKEPEYKPQVASDYVIITTNAIVAGSTMLDAFIAHKESLGYSVLVVTETDFDGLTGQAPNHRAEKIRQWLKNNYVDQGIKYVLLIGDPHPYESSEGDIPMKMCWPRRSETNYREAPTDYFYADLTGNWDKSSDQIYGQWEVDYPVSGGVDFTPEVYVGRIPVYDANYAMLDSILQKSIDYETSPSADWRKSALLPMSFSDSNTDGAALSQQMRDDYLDPNGYSSWRMYQQGSIGSCSDSAYPSEEELLGGTVVRDRWAAGDYGIMCWWGHGNSAQAGVGYSGCSDGLMFDSSYSSSLDDAHPSFTYHCSCLNAYPESSNNLAYAVLQHGGIGTISATRVSWYYKGQAYGAFDGSPSNSGLGYEYVKRLVQELPAGDALYQAKQSINPGGCSETTMNWYGFNLYGDPALGFRVELPNSPPDTPDRPSGSVTGCFNVPYSYSTRALDPDGDQVKYIFNWGDGTTSETSYVDSGTSTGLTHSWEGPGTYFIKARAVDAEGETSGWSDEARILIYRPIKPS
jgi:hypothetical protein